MSVTLKQIRQFTSVELSGDSTGGFYASTASSSSSISQLVDTTWPINNNLPVSELYQDAWLLRPSAVLASDKVRTVSLYTPIGGILAPDLNWANAPYAGGIGEPYELHTIMEPQTALTKCINYGLQRCFIETELTCVPIDDSTQHSMATVAPWLIKGSWVRQVGFLMATEDRNKIDPFERVVRGSTRLYNGTVILNHPGQAFKTALHVIYIKAMMPAYYACTNSLGIVQNGLTLDTDLAPVQLEWASWAAIVEAWRHFSQSLEMGAKTRVIPNRQEAASMFTTLTMDQGRWPRLTFRPLMAGGPLQIGHGGMPAAFRAITA